MLPGADPGHGGHIQRRVPIALAQPDGGSDVRPFQQQTATNRTVEISENSRTIAGASFSYAAPAYSSESSPVRARVDVFAADGLAGFGAIPRRGRSGSGERCMKDSAPEECCRGEIARLVRPDPATSTTRLRCGPHVFTQIRSSAREITALIQW